MTYKLLRVRQILREYCSLFLLILSECLYIHACFFFSTFHFHSRLSILLFFHSLFSSYSYTYAYTHFFSCTYNSIHTRTRTHQPKKYIHDICIFFLSCMQARAHITCIHTLSCSFFRWIGA